MSAYHAPLSEIQFVLNHLAGLDQVAGDLRDGARPLGGAPSERLRGNVLELRYDPLTRIPPAVQCFFE